MATERFGFLRLSACQRKRELQRPRPRAIPAIHTPYASFPARARQKNNISILQSKEATVWSKAALPRGQWPGLFAGGRPAPAGGLRRQRATRGRRPGGRGAAGRCAAGAAPGPDRPTPEPTHGHERVEEVMAVSFGWGSIF